MILKERKGSQDYVLTTRKHKQTLTHFPIIHLAHTRPVSSDPGTHDPANDACEVKSGECVSRLTERE